MTQKQIPICCSLLAIVLHIIEDWHSTQARLTRIRYIWNTFKGRKALLPPHCGGNKHFLKGIIIDLNWNVLFLWRGSLFQICICLWVELELQSRNIQSWNELRSDGNHFHNESTTNVKMGIIIAKKSFSQWIAIAKEFKGNWSVFCSMASDRGVNNPILPNFTTNFLFQFL